jgi:hypothetical protein
VEDDIARYYPGIFLEGLRKLRKLMIFGETGSVV